MQQYASELAAEIQAENAFHVVGMALSINTLMVNGRYQQFTSTYASFSNKGETTPELLTLLDEHADAYIKTYNYEGDKATNARLWVINRIWKKKHERGAILKPKWALQYADMAAAREQVGDLHKAIHHARKSAKAGDPDMVFLNGISFGIQILQDHQLLKLSRGEVRALLDSVQEV